MKRVLVVDDSLAVRKRLHDYVIKQEQYDVKLASNGLEAIQLQRQQPFHVIITDMVMPEMEGMELIMKIRKEYPEAKIIAMSGANPMYRKMALKMGADMELEKPIAEDTFISALNKLMHNKQLTKTNQDDSSFRQ